MDIALPKPARDYFDAANVGDVARMIAPFADDARVKDEGAEIVGRTAIRHWMEETTRKYGAIAHPERMIDSSDALEVIAQVSGNFPGSPTQLTYRFVVERDQIVRLEIH